MYRSIDSSRNKHASSSAALSEKREASLNRKKQFTLLHVIFAIQIAFCISVIVRSRNVLSATDAGILLLVPILQTIWVAAATYLARSRQFFLHPIILRSFPIFWLPFFVAGVQQAIFGGLQEQTTAILNYLPRSTFVGLQTVRVLAVGSLIKWYHGIFPFAFAWFTAFPDMLFGISAIVLLIQGDWIQDDTFLATWNMIGLAIIVPFGAMVLQLGMAPTQLYRSNVPNGSVFEYPMVLGPAAVVPILVSWNIMVAVWAVSRNR